MEREPAVAIRTVPPLARAALLFAALYLAAAATRWAPLELDRRPLRLFSGWACVAAALAFVETARHQQAGRASRAVGMALSAVVVAAVTRLDLLTPAALLLKDVGQLAIAALLGSWLARRIEAAEVLAAISVIVVVTDIWSVTRGVTKTLLETKAIDYFVINFPVFFRGELGYFIGTSDFVGAVLYLDFAGREAASRWRAPLALFAGIAAAGTTAALLGRPLPALPFLVPAFYAAFPGAFRTGTEFWKLLGAGLGIVACVALAFR